MTTMVRVYDEIPADRDEATRLLSSALPGLDPATMESVRQAFDLVVHAPVFEWLYLDDTQPSSDGSVRLMSKAVSVSMMPLSAVSRRTGTLLCIYDVMSDGRSARQGHSTQAGRQMARVAHVPAQQIIARRRAKRLEQILRD